MRKKELFKHRLNSRKYLFNIFVLIVISLVCSCDLSQKEPDGIMFKAVIRDDNDFVTYNDTLSNNADLSKEILDEIQSFQKRGEKILVQENLDITLIFKIRYTSRISVYVVKSESQNEIVYRLIAFDNKTKLYSKTTPIINGKWMENNEAGFNPKYKLLRKPLISFSDIDGDDRNEILMKERVHNGSIYNAVICHYYSIDNFMNLKELICIESRYVCPFENCIVNRSFKNDTIISEIRDGKEKLRIIGKVKITFSDSVEMGRKFSYDEKYEDLLVTGSGISEELFLKEGYTFKY
ncbi:hypothetical protein EYV94_27580 [Puteibacter caeruleilacunae]|nr:hypothetical protein EYV94_27580 [Puteibacter caeruleilacunae]